MNTDLDNNQHQLSMAVLFMSIGSVPATTKYTEGVAVPLWNDQWTFIYYDLNGVEVSDYSVTLRSFSSKQQAVDVMSITVTALNNAVMK